MTDHRKLPDPITFAIEKNEFSVLNNGISIARLSQPVQMYMLKKQYNIREEPGDKIWTLIRNGMLQVIGNSNETLAVYRASQTIWNAMNKQVIALKNSDPDNKRIKTLERVKQIIAQFAREYYPEDRERWLMNQTLGVEMSIEMENKEAGKSMTIDKTVFDKIALYDKVEQVLYLAKLCRAKASFDPRERQGWEEEASIQAFVLEHNGYPVKSAMVMMFFKDYSIQKSMQNMTYPRHPYEVVPLNMAPAEHVEKLIKYRIKKHVAAEAGYVEPCTDKERWKERDGYCIVSRSGHLKDGGKFPFLTAELAQEKIDSNPHLYSGCVVDVKVGKSNRCELYCPVVQYCEQFKALKQKEVSVQTRIEGEKKSNEIE